MLKCIFVKGWVSLGTGEQEDIRMDRGEIKIHRDVKEGRNLRLSKIFLFFLFQRQRSKSTVSKTLVEDLFLFKLNEGKKFHLTDSQ